MQSSCLGWTLHFTDKKWLNLKISFMSPHIGTKSEHHWHIFLVITVWCLRGNVIFFNMPTQLTSYLSLVQKEFFWQLSSIAFWINSCFSIFPNRVQNTPPRPWSTAAWHKPGKKGQAWTRPEVGTAVAKPSRMLAVWSIRLWWLEDGMTSTWIRLR